MSTRIYPNPASDFLNVELNGKVDLLRAELLNTMGQVLRQVKYTSLHGDLIRLDVSDLPAGVYFVRLVGNDFHQTNRVIISR
jgi:hypothetical protein